MRKTLVLFSLLWTILSLWGAAPGRAACSIVISNPGTGANFSVGSNVTLTATATGCPSISQIAFYNNGATLLGTAFTSPYTITWNTTALPTATYNITAVASFVGSVGGPTGVTIDMVGSPSLGPNPASDPSFAYGGSGVWLQGDSQMCLSAWPYNGSDSGSISDGTCEWDDTGGTPPTPHYATSNSTADNLDDTMHTLSDFSIFASTLLNKSVGTLSATFQSWYPQAQAWVSSTCDDGSACTFNVCSDGTMCGRLQPVTGNLNTWETVITNWLNLNYANASTWCLPPSTTGSAAEDTYINTTSGTPTWGDLPHIIACENYNATNAVTNYQACMNLLQNSCPASASGNACDPSILGRSLAGAAPAFDGCTNNYAQWVQNNLTLATNEAPKFALRAQFLNDIYTRAETMQKIFGSGATAIQNFITGPAAQLAGAQAQSAVTQNLPNAVIYGWQDNLPIGGSGGCKDTNGTRVGCSHIVKVVAYSTARCGSSCTTGGIDSLLPWIKTKSGFLTRSYTLMNRDGYVYVSVRRWDQDHSDALTFPNGRPLWQFAFQNPKGTTAASGTGVIGACKGLPLSTGFSGFGLTSQTQSGLSSYNPAILPQDVTSLGNAFMLNDNPGGTVDPNSHIGSYNACLCEANQLLANAPESHACAEYVASSPKSDATSVITGSSQNDDTDYSVKFIDCSKIPGGIPPPDLEGSSC